MGKKKGKTPEDTQGPPPGVVERGPSQGFRQRGPTPGFSHRGPPPGFSQQGPPPGFSQQGSPPGFGQQGPRSSFEPRGQPRDVRQRSPLPGFEQEGVASSLSGARRSDTQAAGQNVEKSKKKKGKEQGEKSQAEPGPSGQPSTEAPSAPVASTSNGHVPRVLYEEMLYKEEKDQHQAEIEKRSRLEENLRTLEDLNIKLWSIVVVRNQIQRLEERMNYNVTFPSKEAMVTALKSFSEWVSPPENVNYRYVKFFYFIKMGDTSLATGIRNIIRQANISIPNFCRIIVKIFGEASFRIHCRVKVMTTDKLIEGLRLYGICEPDVVKCVEVLGTIRTEMPLEPSEIEA